MEASNDQSLNEEAPSSLQKENEESDDLNQPGFKSCDSVENYEFLNQIGQGVYGVVCKCISG